ncbi:Thioredoxin domain-containing protein 5 [Smittium culicis]|uniref:Thioredoxin domain-containing protein 5 n=2 Tax=Smittium culicis TaxID=133412 RepID=A0A1R1XLV7_9FUNG|nr:Thioredoxin domain-containing protein 5 [Smittium culicis]
MKLPLTYIAGLLSIAVYSFASPDSEISKNDIDAGSKIYIITDNDKFKAAINANRHPKTNKRDDIPEIELRELNKSDFAEYISTERKIIKFYSPTCSACRSFLPIWQKVAENFISTNVNSLNFANIDCTAYKNICNDQKINSYPTVIGYLDGKKISSIRGYKAFIPATEFVLDYIKKIKADPAFVDNKSSTSNQKETIPSDPILTSDVDSENSATPNKNSTENTNVQNNVVLTPDNFTDLTSKNSWLIKYYSPKCSHCIAFAPVWTEFTDIMAKKTNPSGLFYGQVDCLEFSDLCTKNEIDGYPTVNFYTDGKLVKEIADLKSGEIKKISEGFINKDKLPQIPESTQANSEKEKSDGKESNTSQKIANDSPTTTESSDFAPSSSLKPNSDDLKISKQNFVSRFANILVDNSTMFYTSKYIPITEKIHTAFFNSSMHVTNFIAPDCAECDSITKILTESSTNFGSQINFGYIDCKKSVDLCLKNSITYSPTLKLIFNNYNIEYPGKLSNSSQIIEFIKEIYFTKNDISNTLNLEKIPQDRALNLNDFNSKEKALMFIYVNKSGSVINYILTRLASILSLNGNFYHLASGSDFELHLLNSFSNSDKKRNLDDTNKDFLVAVIDGKLNMFSGDITDIIAISDWMNISRESFYSLPLLDVSSDDFYSANDNSDISVIAVTGPSDKSEIDKSLLIRARANLKLFPGLTKSLSDKKIAFSFVEVLKNSEAILNLFDIPEEKFPVIIFTEPKKGSFYLPYTTDLLDHKIESSHLYNNLNNRDIFSMIFSIPSFSEKFSLNHPFLRKFEIKHKDNEFMKTLYSTTSNDSKKSKMFYFITILKILAFAFVAYILLKVYKRFKRSSPLPVYKSI